MAMPRVSPCALAFASKARPTLARTKQLNVRVVADEFLRLAAAAGSVGLTPTAWIRHQALRAAAGLPQSPWPFRPPPPKSPPAKLTRTAGTRFTEEQFLALAQYALDCGLPLTAFIRQVVLGFKPRRRRPLADSAILAINRVGNNLNQLVHLAHTGILLAPELLRAILDVRNEIHSLRDALLDDSGSADPADSADADDFAEPLG
jgi:hypothetical protein